MPARDSALRDAGFSLPVFERIAPAPSPELLAARIDALTRSGDVVLDVASRGGWTARAALEQQRRAVLLESDPLTRLLAEVVLRPPDVRHLDAAFQAIAASPRRQTNLRTSIDELFATRCPRCGRTSAADEYIWETTSDGPRVVRKHYRCLTCRDQVRGGELRRDPVDEDDVARARELPEDSAARERLRERFAVPPAVEPGPTVGSTAAADQATAGDQAAPPTSDASAIAGSETHSLPSPRSSRSAARSNARLGMRPTLPDELLALHTPRQLVGLDALVERIDADLRAPQVEAALRLALLHTILPSSRLNGFPGRIGALRISGGHVRPPTSAQWRERNPWVAFEDAFRLIRGFVQRLEGAAPGSVQPRFGDDLRSLTEGATTVVRLATDEGLDRIAAEAPELARLPDPPRIRLVLGQTPPRPNTERLSLTYLATCWVLGREAASFLPLEPLFGSSPRYPWHRHAAAIGRNLAAVAPVLAADARAVLLVDSGAPEAVVAAVLGGIGAGYRLVDAHIPIDTRREPAVVELVPPGASLPPGPRTRANVPLPAIPGGAGDPDMLPGRGLFSPPERYDQRPFTASEVGRTITDAVVAVLQSRGEPAGAEQLLGEVLVALDRAGQLKRLVAEEPLLGPSAAAAETGETRDRVEFLLEAIRTELDRPGHRRIAQVEPGRWWLADREDRAAASPPLADRVEWAVFSLLSTAGTLSEPSFRQRIGHLFAGHDTPDDALVRACLESYRSPASSRDHLRTDEDLARRSAEHAEMIGLLADLGHLLGLSVWIGRREQEHRVRGRPLGEWLDRREREAYLPLVHHANPGQLEQVDCIWYVRSRVALMFEVEWTAMLAEPVLRRHAQIPSTDDLVRFLVVAPERAGLVRFKMDRSALLREAIERDNWHLMTWDRLREFAARPEPSLADLEPYLGLASDVPATAADQLALFE